MPPGYEKQALAVANFKRRQTLTEWMARVNAVHQKSVPLDSGHLEWWMIRGTTVIVHHTGQFGGWQLYLPASHRAEIAATLEAAEEFLGITADSA